MRGVKRMAAIFLFILAEKYQSKSKRRRKQQLAVNACGIAHVLDRAVPWR